MRRANWPLVTLLFAAVVGFLALLPLADEPALSRAPTAEATEATLGPDTEAPFTLDDVVRVEEAPREEASQAEPVGESQVIIEEPVELDRAPVETDVETAFAPVDDPPPPSPVANEIDDPEPEVPRELQLVGIADGLGDPVMVTLHPTLDGSYFIVDHDGTIRLLDADFGLHPDPVLNLSEKVHAEGESGVHTLTFHPKDPERAFLVYNDLEGALLLSEIPFMPDGLRFVSEAERVLLRVPPAYGAHNGCALAFGPDGYLYFSVGDGGSQDDPDGRAQDLGDLHGKILRIDVDRVRGAYGVPSDNPFTDIERSEIWLVGFRNPWRMTFDPATNDLWITDVGGSTAEEIDRHAAGDPPGLNYGWPTWEGTTLRRSGAELTAVPPMHEYRPSSGRCAITGGVFYRESALLPLKDAYLYSDFCDGKLRAFEQTEDGWATREVMPLGRLVVHIAEDRDHTLLVLHYGGTLSRVVFA